MSANPSPSQPGLAERLAKVRVGLREDLEVTRHVFRGRPSYAVRDPLTGQSQRLDLDDYAVFSAVSADRPLSGIFKTLVEQNVLTEEDHDRFYQFILSLHGLGFLRLPIADHAMLYRRHQAKLRSKRIQALTGFLFLRIPLWNPNAFLERTMHRAKFLFSRSFFFAWLGLILSAAYVAARNWDQLRQPLEGIFVAGNLPVLWVTLVVLKVFHEFGHAYACKRFGGHVPEMGAYLILFTPCAYVDATACWGFSRKRERIIVCLAGMYLESIFAAIAVFVWAMTPPGLVHSVAYNVMFLASVVTILFNVNPLMRYDGYYVLSDLSEVPNLRERSARYLNSLMKRILLGVTDGCGVQGRRLKALLLGYGIAALAYRITLVLGIAVLLASKFLVAGLLFGFGFVGTTLFKSIRKLMHYLWHDEETLPVRGRAVAWGVVALVFLPALAVCVPLPRGLRAAGAVVKEHETVIRAEVPGILSAIHVIAGSHVSAGQELAELTDETRKEELAVSSADLQAAQARADAFRFHSPAMALAELAKADALGLKVDRATAKLNHLRLRAGDGGEVVQVVTDCDLGRFVHEGFPVALVVSGDWQLRALLSGEQIGRSRPRAGDAVVFRPAGDPSRVLRGTIQHVSTAGTKNVTLPWLTQAAGGGIIVDPQSQESLEPHFEITIALDDPHSESLRHGMTGMIQFRAPSEAVAQSLMRRVRGFLNKMSEE